MNNVTDEVEKMTQPTTDAPPDVSVVPPMDAPPIGSAAVDAVPLDEAPADGAPGHEAPAEAAPPEQPSAEAANGTPAEQEAEPVAEDTTPVELPPVHMDWYILKVQSNREDSIRESLQRRVAIAGLDRYFDEVIVPTEMVSEFKGGKKRIVKRKLYPGYLVVHMEINEDTWFLVRETPGIGDFTGSVGKPTPMLPHEVQRIIAKQEEKTDEAPKLKIAFNKGDRVKINEGTFENFEGEVEAIDEANGRVTVMINIFGRSTPVELEYWQIEAV
jgi:transcriptional antiterminator NusG